MRMQADVPEPFRIHRKTPARHHSRPPYAIPTNTAKEGPPMRETQKTSTFSATALRESGRRVLLGVACAMLSIAASAQIYPNFTAGGKTDLRTDESPAMTILYLPTAPGELLNWEPAMAYRDSATGHVAVSLSKDGVHWSSPVDTGVATDKPIALTNTQSGGLYILVYTGGGYQYITSPDGVTFTPPQPVALSIGGRTLRPRFEPGLTGYDTGLYLAVVDAAPGSPDAVDVLISYDDGQSFSSIALLSDIPTRSGASFTIFPEPGTRYSGLALAYTTGPEKHPVFRTFDDYKNCQCADDWSSNIITTVRMAGTPQLMTFQPPGSNNDLDLYIFGRSADEGHHLVAVDWAWIIYVSDTFEPPQSYNRDFRHSPALSFTRAGQLVIAFESKGGNRIQTYTAPHR